MPKIHIVGNPNSGKTTLFNSLTSSHEHIGNWHGVTVDRASKTISFKDDSDKEYEVIDLPGLYSLNAFSMEEQISVNEIEQADNILYLLDACNFKRSLFLAINLLIKNKKIKILINNYKFFEKNGGKLNIEYLKIILGCEIDVVDARKIKPKKEMFNFNNKSTAFITALRNQVSALELMDNTNYEIECQKTKLIYDYIDKICKNCFEQKIIYGYNKFDKILLSLGIFLPMFILAMFGIIFITFFLLGPMLSEWFALLLNYSFKYPAMAILNRATNSKFILALFSEGIFGACFSVLSFLPQIALMYFFLSLFENSGLISRLAFVVDDALQKIGLNGKMVYTLLMGFGCSTTACLSAKNMNDKNSQIKAGLLTPLMSCSAKLPIYMMVALAIGGVNSVALIFGLYMLGIIVAIILAIIFNSTILPSKDAQFILEFPALKFPNMSAVWGTVFNSCKQFLLKVFGIIFSISVILWLLTNLNIKFEYVTDNSKSILYAFSTMISWMFKPLGLNNPNIICALLIGLVAKELILSSFAISNHITSLALLGESLVLSSSAVNFNLATGITFLVFVLLYCPCVSNIGVLLKEVGTKYTMLGVGSQLIMAYGISWAVYSLLMGNIVKFLLAILVLVIVVASIKLIFNKIKNKNIFCSCNSCNKCKK